MEPQRHDPVGQPRYTPTLAFGEPEEVAKLLRIISDGEPAAAAGVPPRDSSIDVGDSDRSQGHIPFVEPLEEAVNRIAARADRLLGPSAIPTHPRRKNRNLASEGVSRLARFCEQIHEAQPP